MRSPIYVRSRTITVTVQFVEGKGYLEVHVYYMGAEVLAEITITTLEGVYIGTYTSPRDFPLLLDVGQYVVTAKYRTYTKTETIAIEEGKVTVWRVYFERRLCFIATVCYGYGNPSLIYFRNFRDRFLKTNWLGKLFIYAYYFKIGLPIALFLKHHESFRHLCKSALDAFLNIIKRIKLFR